MTTATRPTPSAPREYHFPRFTKRVLENGITIIVATVIDATAVSDPSGKEGNAELTAQVLREGTAKRGGVQLALDLEKLGTSLVTGADWDSTVASMTVLNENLKEAFSIFSEALMSPAFREEDVERLKAERLAERIQILDEPRGLADESFSRFLYQPKARYSAPMSGGSKSVSAITREDVETFYRDNYSPQAMTVILAGDITVDQGVELISSMLGSWTGNRTDRKVNADDPARKTRAVEIIAKPDAAQSELRIGHVGVPRMHPDYFSIVV